MYEIFKLLSIKDEVSSIEEELFFLKMSTSSKKKEFTKFNDLMLSVLNLKKDISCILNEVMCEHDKTHLLSEDIDKQTSSDKCPVAVDGNGKYYIPTDSELLLIGQEKIDGYILGIFDLENTTDVVNLINYSGLYNAGHLFRDLNINQNIMKDAINSLLIENSLSKEFLESL